jgi:hypothetical protein
MRGRTFARGLGLGITLWLAALALPAGGAPAFVWLEGETAGGESGDKLSGNAMAWLGPGTKFQRPVTVPAAGTYQFWVRSFWAPQTFRWRIRAGPWNEVSAKHGYDDLVDLGPGRKVGWFLAGEAALAAGATTLEFEVTDPKTTTAYDCFVLSLGAFSPRGKLKPDERTPVNEPGWFAFEPPADPFAPTPLDLRVLNEKFAGEGGHIVARGEEFAHGGSGRAVRFWAVNTGPDMARRSRAEVDLFARSLAKRGVNLVRLHGPIYAGSGPKFGEVDTEQIARLHYLVTALKREGIYTCLSIYFPLWARLGPENTAFPGYAGGKHPFALLYFNEAFQTLYRSWWEALLTPVNPHTGLALKDDPAVALAELVNEDSVFFWTFNPDAAPEKTNLPEPQRALLERQFADWLKVKYPGLSLAEIRTGPWQGLAVAHDALADGRVGFRPLWALFNERRPRDRDTARFLAELQATFYRRHYDYLKRTLGFRGLVQASNWTTANGQYLGPLDQWSNAVTDYLDQHGYYEGRHTGDAAGYAIQAGQKYDERSALNFRSADGTQDDFSNPLFDVGYAGKPSVISEVNFPPPNRRRADFPVLAAAYGALQGTDAVMHFAAGATTWESRPAKFSVQTPAVLGQFPATALIYRLGLVREAPKVADLRVTVDDLFALRGAPVPAAQNFDALRAADVPPGATLTNVTALDALAFLVGRVSVDFVTNGPAQSQVTDLSPYLDRAARTAKSQTGELGWNWDRGFVQLSAPAAQGVTGFLGAAGRVDLPDVVIESPLEYGSLLVVALDTEPLARSARQLVQVMSEEKPLGWETDAPTGIRTIRNAGQAPILVRQFAGSVKWKVPPSGAKITPLDVNGYPAGKPDAFAGELKLAPETLYYLIER